MQTETYRFVGRDSLALGKHFTSVGERVELTEEQFDEVAMRGRVALIPDEMFEKIFEGEQENLDKYCQPHFYGTVPAPLQSKIEAARDAYRQIHAAFQAQQ